MSNSASKRSQYHSMGGFTILELLVVVVILSSIAYAALALLENNSDQVYFEDTRTRLENLRMAIIGPPTETNLKRGVMSGFVAENGRLPRNIEEMVTTPSGYKTYAEVIPQFDKDAAEGDINDDTNVVDLTDANYLQKGHRIMYLFGLRNDKKFEDGWNNQLDPTSSLSSSVSALDCPEVSIGGNPDQIPANKGNNVYSENHGWCVSVDPSTSPNKMFVTSYGRDGSPGEITAGNEYEKDRAFDVPILLTDWTANISSRIVKLVNLTGTDIGTDGTPLNLRALLLAFINNGDDDATAGTEDYVWKHFYTDLATNCFDGNATSTDCTSGVNEFTVQFGSGAGSVPIGEHIVVIIDDSLSSGSVGDGDESLYNGGSGGPHTRRVKFYPRAGIPEMSIEIR